MTDKIKIDAFDRFMAVSHFDDEWRKLTHRLRMQFIIG